MSKNNENIKKTDKPPFKLCFRQKTALGRSILPGHIHCVTRKFYTKDDFVCSDEILEKSKSYDKTPREKYERTVLESHNLAAANLLPFVGDLRDPSHAKMAYIYSVGRHLEYNKYDKISIRITAIGELLAPQFENKKSLNESKSRQKIISVVRTLLLSEELEKLSYLDTKIWLKESENGFLEKLSFKNENKQYWPISIPIKKKSFLNKNGQNMLTPTIAMAILALMTIHGKPVLKDELLNILLGMHIGLLDSGVLNENSISDLKKFKSKINTDVSKEYVKTVYKAYKPDFDDKVARSIFIFWDSWIAPDLRFILQPEVKASFDKLNGINIIKKAIISFPDFGWDILSLNPGYLNELKNVCEAMSLIKSNPYYVYKKDKGIVDSSNFKNIELIAKTLLEGKSKYYETLPKSAGKVVQDYFQGKDIENRKTIPDHILTLVREIKINAGLVVPEVQKICYTVEDVHKRIDKIMKNGCMEKSYSIRYSY